jgi:hypothetical protein
MSHPKHAALGGSLGTYRMTACGTKADLPAKNDLASFSTSALPLKAAIGLNPAWMAAFDCDFNRSTQHFIPRSFRYENVFESNE